MSRSELKRIGFLATQFDEYYQNLVFHGAMEEARLYPMQLIFYEGSNTDTLAKEGALDDTAFTLATKAELDGLIVMTNTMGSTYSKERISGYLASFKDIPKVSIGLSFDGIYSLVADTSGGIAQITAHLVEIHHRKNFLFLAGPEHHPESEARKEEFLSMVSSLLPKLSVTIIHADFLEECAYQEILSEIERKWSYDAVVAANDQMALGAIRALEEHGILVPTDVSVTGFDDIPYSTLSIPALTTIHQPTTELGRRAISFLAKELNIHDGLGFGLLTDLSSAFVIRQSCGCINEEQHTVELGETTGKQQLRNLFSLQIGERARSEVLRRIEAALVRSFSLDDILKAFGEGLKRLGIRFGAVVLFDREVRSIEWANLQMIINGESTNLLTPYGLRFGINQILPEGLPCQFGAYVCEPLQFGSEQIGYFLCTPDATNLYVYATLRDILTTSIKGSIVMGIERDRKLALEREVENRTVELREINRQLKQEVAQRKILERELLENSNKIMTRIGQDIHDEICQELAALGMLAATLESSLEKNGNHHALDLARTISASALNSAYAAKLIARDLYPSDLEEGGLVHAVSQLVLGRSYPKEVSVHLDMQPGFHVRGKEKSFHLYRIVQEALSNALTHAEARHINVGLYNEHGIVTVKVEDDGKGFVLKKGKASLGMGLKILSYRANLIEGKLTITSNENGTVVICRVDQ